jgi:imidazolonepropionase-like amidohydrolase
VSGSALLATTIVFRGATLVDGTGAPPRPNTLLVVTDGRIEAVRAATPEAQKSLPPGARIVDATGTWIVPGLVDAHVHSESDDDLETMLRWGVTSVRLMAEDSATAVALAKSSESRSDIPQVFPAAPIFTVKGGWWDQGEPPDTHLDRFPSTVETARAAVRTAKSLGVAEIKLMLDDMAWCRAPRPALPRMSEAVATALIGEARAQGLRAIVHAPNGPDARTAVSAGATGLAHGVLDSIDAESLAAMRARPVFYVPTMDIFEFLADTRAFLDAVLSDPHAARGLAPETLTKYRSAEYARGYAERYPNFDNVHRSLPRLRENLRQLQAAGVPVALGTDMWAFPGLGVSIEMDLWVKAGLNPLQVLRAATQVAARSIGAESDRGTLEPGRRADFVILEADPIADVKNTRRIREVWKKGRPAWTAARP